MNALDPKVATLLQQAKDGLSPTENDAQRMALRLQGALHASTPNASEPVGTSWLSAGKLKSTLVGASIGLGVGIGIGYHLHQPPVEHSPSPDTPSVVVAPLAAPSDDTALSDETALFNDNSPPGEAVPDTNAETLDGDEPTPGAIAMASPPAQHPAPSTRKAPSTVAKPVPAPAGEAVPAVDEVEQVRRVQRALAQRQSGLALRLLDELDRALPQGRLLEERAAASAIARCMSNPNRGALEYGVFSQRYPHSVHDKRVFAICTKAIQTDATGTNR